MRSRLVALVPGLLALAVLLPPVPAPASAGQDASEWGPGAVRLRLYGAYAPIQMERATREESQPGYGAGIALAASDRWGVMVDASHFEGAGRSVTPLLFGATYEADARRSFRPRVEFGAGFYKLHDPVTPAWQPSFDMGVQTVGISGNRGVPGGYLGIGADWVVAPRLGFTFSVRAHNWADEGRALRVWDGFVGASAGLSILLSRETPRGEWASR